MNGLCTYHLSGTVLGVTGEKTDVPSRAYSLAEEIDIKQMIKQFCNYVL